MADWAEVHRLAADFQRLQASSTAHKLSERNCVELVTKLVQRGLLEIVHTLDGKEYVTPGQLDREIRDELAAHGGDVTYRSYDEYSIRSGYWSVTGQGEFFFGTTLDLVKFLNDRLQKLLTFGKTHPHKIFSLEMPPDRCNY